MENIRSLFFLDSNVTFLNHGSFGATPLPVLEAYQNWQQRLERQPVKFLIREFPDLMAHARQKLGEYINAHPDDLVYVSNATFGLNVIARSLELGPEDEVLTTNHEYGACDNVWKFLSRKKGFTYVQQNIPLTFESPEHMIKLFWQGVTPKTKVIYLSHITSATAVTFPVDAICKKAREAGIFTIIDGAHAPGQIPLDMHAIGADVYFGNAHKWMCSPKGAAFLYTRKDKQHLVEPLIIGWGWGENKTFTYGSDYLDYLQWPGTKDFSAYLSVPAAIQFQEDHNWTAVRQSCHTLLTEALEQVSDITKVSSPYADDNFYHQMAVAPIPPISDLPAFKNALYDQYCVEIPGVQWGDQQFIRISIQGYNTKKDVETLLKALQHLLPIYQA
ncbi:MAG: aminotransferase class V-fold PLP-dependent enzyme [Anaerolineales bacterium]|nr:aminotransferase class V-fold PLP-dependent enzyme [Anaerolineales bacterium]